MSGKRRIAAKHGFGILWVKRHEKTFAVLFGRRLRQCRHWLLTLPWFRFKNRCLLQASGQQTRLIEAVNARQQTVRTGPFSWLAGIFRGAAVMRPV
jgi:hypothetical protein